MRFYVSWYPGDPDYPLYDDDCSMLISISSVARDWTIKQLPRLPKRLMLDSGGFRFATAPREAISPKQILLRQLSMLDGHEVPTIICARDYPILDMSASSNMKDKSITQTIAYAYELQNLIVQSGLPNHVTPMAVVQGYDADSIAYCARELKALGYPLYGIGSLAPLRQHGPIMDRVKAAASILGAENVHILGVSAIRTLQTLHELGIHSVDSTRPAKAAAYNEILYSRPFRRCGIFESDKEVQAGRLPRHRRLDKPLPCDCPVCKSDAESIMVVGKRENIRSRALHNYYHLKQVFIEQERTARVN
jgi:7-cyano-7-deazaguanine tRNA-ribosyltransferase